MKDDIPTVSELLTRAFERKKRARSGFSVRSVARDLGIDYSFLSKVLRGDKRLPSRLVPDLIKKLEMDELSGARLKRLVIEEGTDLHLEETGITKKTLEDISEYDERSTNDTDLFEHWSQPAILDLTTCSNFSPDLEWIAKRLRIKPQLVARSLEFLERRGFLVKDGNSYRKTHRKIRLPMTKSTEVMREYHRQVMKLAMMELESYPDDESYKRRAIHTLTVAADPKKIEQAKQKILTALYEAAEILASGDSTEVYKFQISLFPVTRSKTEK